MTLAACFGGWSPTKHKPMQPPKKKLHRTDTFFDFIFDKKAIEHVDKKKMRFYPCHLSDFDFGPILGTGSFGRVHFATHAPSKTVCAIKILSKSQMIKSKQVMHLRAERDILQRLQHQFLVNLMGIAQDDDNVYFVMEYVVGGEFFTHLRSVGRFAEESARFYAAEIVLAFEYMHDLNVVYRDLKPENLLLDNEGHVKITDFGFAKEIDSHTYTLCGTPDYLSPEIIQNKGHGKATDWWSFGVLLYELMAGYPPFFHEDPMMKYRNILAGHLEFPPYLSRAARDLIRKLLTADPSKRLGNLKGGARDLKSHPFFAGVDWGKLARREWRQPPIIPVVTADDDTSNFDDYSGEGPPPREFTLTFEEQRLFEDF